MEALITELPKQTTLSGVLLVLLALSLLLIVFLGKMVFALQDKRLADQRETNAETVKPIRAIQEASEQNTRVLMQIRDTVDDLRREK